MAVCAAPTTMIATLAAISSVFRSFSTFLPRDSGASPAVVDSAPALSTGIASGGIDAGIGGGIGRQRGGVGARRAGTAARPEVLRGFFLNGHLNHLPACAPSDFGTFTGVSR